MSRRGAFIALSLCARIGRPSGGNHDGAFTLTIEDNASHLIILEAVMTPEAFADLLSNREAAMDGDFSRSERVGKRHENQTVQVPVGEVFEAKDRNKLLNATIRAFVDANWPGWEPDSEDSWNHHRVSGRGKDMVYGVTIRRWVDAEQAGEKGR